MPSTGGFLFPFFSQILAVKRRKQVSKAVVTFKKNENLWDHGGAVEDPLY